MSKHQVLCIINSLESLQICVNEHKNYIVHNCQEFYFRKNIGICGHLEKSLENPRLLLGAFLALGYDTFFPVECSIHGMENPFHFHMKTTNKYDPETECGKIRIKLIQELLDYFNKELEQYPEEV